MTNGTGSNGDSWEFYQDKTNGWRWRRMASNGGIVDSSKESYADKTDCITNARENGLTSAPA